MDIAAAVGYSVAAQVADSTVVPVKNHIGYLLNHEREFQHLKVHLEKLMAQRERLLQDVFEAKRQGEEISSRVMEWLTSTDKLIRKVNYVREEAKMAKKKSFIGLFPNVKSRYQLGRRAHRDVSAILELLEEGSGFDIASSSLPGLHSSTSRDFVAFESRKFVLNEIVGALKNDSVSVIGVYGLGGVGKTKLVMEVARRDNVVQLFNFIAMVVVSEAPNIRRIQAEIADLLGLKFEEVSIVERAARLRERLKKERKILVILDDISHKLDLMEVGIPFGDQHPGCKLLLTSRVKYPFFEMALAVDVLTEAEAWELFKTMVGDPVESRDLRPIAIKIAGYCRGLPLAILTVARALRHKGLFEWVDALQQLRRHSSSDFTRTNEMMDPVYSSIELSYNHLESEEVRQTFLLCSILGHHAAIQDLLKYIMGLGLLSGLNTVEEMRNRLLKVVSELKASCLLRDSYTNESFDMHDLVSNAALKIASRDKRVLALKHNHVITDWPDGETMKKCDRISLQYATVTELPDELKCPALTFFYMGNKDPSLKMPQNFFKEMRNLKVLDLTKMHFSSLPSSICLLTDLRTLCLDQCVLGNIAVIGELKNLEILSLLRSDVEALPSETGQLVKLKLLDLSGCTELKVIASNVLSQLSRLEELYLGDSFVQWRTGGDGNQRSIASLTEFRHLQRLSTLDVHIHDDRIMPNDMFPGELKKYKVFIGDVWDWSGKFECSRTLKLKLNTSIDLHPGVKRLLKKTEDLYLDELKGVKNVLYELNEEGFPDLKNLHVQNNSEILYIVNTMKWSPLKAFHSLESLILHNLINLKEICHGQLGAWSFSNLRILKVRCCGGLMNLFSSSLVKGLSELKEFEVTDCKNMMELVTHEKEGETSEIEANRKIELAELRILTIQYLPRLISFCSDGNWHSTSQQGKVQLTGGTSCWTISLFDEKVVFPKLEYLKLSALNILILWHDRHPQVSFSVKNLTTLVVEGCNNLQYLFSSFIVNDFEQLRNLEISCSEVMKEVIVMKESMSRISLPNLASLSLHGLPKLEGFCFKTCVEFPILRELTIRNCPLLNVFIPSSVTGSTSKEPVEGNNSKEKLYTDTPLFDDQVAFPSLEKIIIIDLQNLKKIWHSQCKSDSFYKLKYLEVGSCKELKNIFPVEMLEKLGALNELNIHNCASLEVIVESREANAGESNIVMATQSIMAETVAEPVFPSVEYLQLYMLPNLTSFYPKLHTTKWPSLQKMQVCGCQKVHILASEFLGFLEERHLEMFIQQPLFWVHKATFPCLQELWLEWNAVMKEIWLGQLQADQYFPRLKVLKLIRIPEESTILSSCFFSFSKIPSLIVSDASFSELFQWEGFSGGREEEWTLGQLSELSLSKLPQLAHLWNESIHPQSIFGNLRTLKILGCGGLKNAVPSSISLQNLMTLEVSKCHGLVNLISPKTAKSMEQLTKMSIADCKLMKEIIASEDGDLTDEIVFLNLKYLGFQLLPSLTSFYSGNCTFDLPSLDELNIGGCPKMENFSIGILRAEMLQGVHLTEGDSHYWAGDLNATIRDLHTKKSQNYVKELGSLRWELPKLWVTSV